MIALFASLALGAPDALDAAYQREYAYLQAELQALQEQQTRLQQDSERRVREAQAELADVKSRVLARSAQRNAVEDELFQASVASENRTAASDRVDGLLVRAEATLPGFATPQGDTPELQGVAFDALLVEADGRLAEGQRVHVEPGSWFALDGAKQEGEILRYGRVAAVAVGHGPLAPAGEGRLVRVEGGQGFYLFEGEAKRSTPEPEKTVGDQLRAGGVVGFVILGLGAVGVVLALLRVLTMVGVRKGAVRRVVEAVHQAPASVAEDHATEAILRETPTIERFSTPILVIAAVAPLLGLLGTVTGMIATFEILTTFGTGDPRMLSGGISEALVTTQLGLIVAIPMLLVGNLLDRAGNNLLTKLETAAMAALNAPPTPGPEHRLAAK